MCRRIRSSTGVATVVQARAGVATSSWWTQVGRGGCVCVVRACTSAECFRGHLGYIMHVLPRSAVKKWEVAPIESRFLRDASSGDSSAHSTRMFCRDCVQV